MTGRSSGTDVFGLPDFTRFWAAETVSGFGTYVTTIALQVLVVLTLGGSAVDVGLVSAARWLPYVVLGLVVGALVDRARRRPVLVGTDLGRAALLVVIPLLWLVDRLDLAALLVVMVLFGALSLVNDAASQSFLPRLVPRASLLAANARLGQSAAVAQTSGPLVGAALVSALGAPVAVLVDAASYVASAVLTARIRTEEPVPARTSGGPRLRTEVAEGLRWIYRHEVLARLALTTHGWFVCNSVVVTVFVPFVLLRLGFTAFELGVTLAAAGVGGLVGSLVATRAGLRWGAGRTVVTCRLIYPVAWAVIALAPVPGPGESTWAAVAVVGAGQLLYGLAMGLENPNDLGYWQAVTPDALQGRMNATRRSVNRAMIVVGAPAGGLLADTIGDRPALWIAIGGFALVAAALALSPFRHARHDDPPTLLV